jgi:hypothetical protein
MLLDGDLTVPRVGSVLTLLRLEKTEVPPINDINPSHVFAPAKTTLALVLVSGLLTRL